MIDDDRWMVDEVTAQWGLLYQCPICGEWKILDDGQEHGRCGNLQYRISLPNSDTVYREIEFELDDG